MNEPWLTKREVAAKLKVSTRTIERLKPPCMRVGNQCPSGSLHANPRQAATPSPVARVEHLTAPRSFRSDPAEIGSGPVAAGSVAPPEIGSRPTPPERSTR